MIFSRDPMSVREKIMQISMNADIGNGSYEKVAACTNAFRKVYVRKWRQAVGRPRNNARGARSRRTTDSTVCLSRPRLIALITALSRARAPGSLKSGSRQGRSSYACTLHDISLPPSYNALLTWIHSRLDKLITIERISDNASVLAGSNAELLHD